MATHQILLPLSDLVHPDASDANARTGRRTRKGTETSAPQKHFRGIEFAQDLNEHVWWAIGLPTNYVGTGQLVLWGIIAAQSCNVRMGAYVSATTPGDADTPIEHAKGAIATVSIAASATENNRLISGTITLNMDGAAASDLVIIGLLRDAENVNDTCGNDAFHLIAAAFRYSDV